MLEARVIRDPVLLRQAQALRCRVFADEVGSQPGPATSRETDEDRFDDHCEHVVVRDLASDLVVGACRILAPDAARRAGGYHAEELFDLVLLKVLRERMVEVGRPCVHPEYRFSPVMQLLWSGLARYLIENGHDYLFGCASIGIADGGHAAASLFRATSERSPSPDDLRVVPRRGLPLERLCETLTVQAPPVLRGYLAHGAWVCGEPAWDAQSHRAELPLLLPLARMQSRHVRPFLSRAA